MFVFSPRECFRIFNINSAPQILEIGKWEILHQGDKTVVLAVGPMVGMIIDNKDLIYKTIGYLPTIVNARFIKPLDGELLLNLCKNHERIITIEEGVLTGGFGSAVSAFLHDTNQNKQLSRLGIPDNFVQHGTRNELLKEVGLTVENLISVMDPQINKQEVYEL